LAKVSRSDTPLEPAHPLGGASVGKGVRGYVTTGFTLQAIVPNAAGGLQRLFHVTGFENMPRFLRVVGPDAGQAIRLQFHHHRQSVGFRLARASPEGLNPIGDSQQVLDMVPDFMGDDIGLGKVSGGSEFVLQVP
jgi:hypothetical protein